MKIIFLGHASLLVMISNNTLLIDPYIAGDTALTMDMKLIFNSLGLFFVYFSILDSHISLVYNRLVSKFLIIVPNIFKYLLHPFFYFRGGLPKMIVHKTEYQYFTRIGEQIPT